MRISTAARFHESAVTPLVDSVTGPGSARGATSAWAQKVSPTTGPPAVVVGAAVGSGATSLDELPQLWNVVRGDMSPVGPRPSLPQEVIGYSDDATRRLRVRPGMTGLWQVSGRSDLSWEESLLLDLRYVDNWSLTLDATILWRTWRAVVGRSGAY